MKRILIAVFALMMVSSAALAAHKKSAEAMSVNSSATESDLTGSWVLQAQGGLNILASSPGNLVTIGGVGYGVEGSFGYDFSNNFSLSLMGGYDAIPGKNPGFPVTGVYMTYLPFQLEGKYNLGTVDFDPYVTLGAGIAVNALMINGILAGVGQTEEFTETDFLLSPGFGVSFPLAPKANFFVQARVDLDFFSSNYANALSNAGTKKFDTPQIFIPIQAGLSFDVK
jgi:hypothetical protein